VVVRDLSVLRLRAELARMDRLLDAAVFLAPFAPFCSLAAGGRRCRWSATWAMVRGVPACPVIWVRASLIRPPF
jgi:hypothetical protein